MLLFDVNFLLFFTTFANVSLTELMTIVGSMDSMSRHLDPIPD